MTRAELWESYRPKLEEAKELDRKESAETLIRHPVIIGGEWINPLTIETLLFLQAVDHPVLRGTATTRDDLLSFLWICGQDFKPQNNKAYKRWKRRFWFRDIDRVSEELSEWLTKEFGNTTDSSEAPSNHWCLTLIDILASEYGWSEDEIMRLSVKRAFAYGSAIVRRHDPKHEVGFKLHADKVRNDYLNELSKLEAAR